MTWVGLDNYVRALNDPVFVGSFVHVLIYIAATLVLEVVVGLGLAGLASMRRGGLWFRVAIFTPGAAADGGRRGALAVRLQPRLRAPQRAPRGGRARGAQRIWLGDPATALLAVSVVSGWVYAGFYMIIFYAAFRQVPAEVIEAARLDGAGEWALFARVKVPMIRGAIAVAVLLCVTGGFQGFDLFYVMTNGAALRRDRDPHDPARQDRVPVRRTWATAPRWPCCSPRSWWAWASCTRGSRHAARWPPSARAEADA